MELLPEKKVSKIVAENYKTAAVFTRHSIDFCCNGGIPLKDACSLRDLNVEEVTQELMDVLTEPVDIDYQQMRLSQLIDHIVSKHHTYIEATIPMLENYLSKLCEVHGERHPELHKVAGHFHEAAGALTAHMKKEEFILFPFIKSLSSAKENGYALSPPHFGHINNPISMMEHEHSTEGERFRKISAMTNGYQPPADGCQTYRVAYSVLQEFENDLHLHIHLENNLLFPKSLALYQEMFIVSN